MPGKSTKKTTIKSKSVFFSGHAFFKAALKSVTLQNFNQHILLTSKGGELFYGQQISGI
jgi:hypothetical protein